MKNLRPTKIAVAVATVLFGTATLMNASGQTVIASKKKVEQFVRPPRPKLIRLPQHASAPIPKPEPSVAASNAGFATSSALSVSSAITPASQTLSAPVTLSYGGSSVAFSIADSGQGRGLSSSVTNTGSGSSALYGDTIGSGAGLTGYNLGVVGPGGKFEVTNANSAQAGAFASTNGSGPGILGTITNTTSYYPAIYGVSTAGSAYGMGVEGEGNYVGVEGYVPSSSTATGATGVYGENDSTAASSLDNFAVFGYSASGSGNGVGAVANSGYGVYSTSSSNYAVYAVSSTGNAIYAETDSDGGFAAAVYGTTTGGNALTGVATVAGGWGVYGTSADGMGVHGEDSSSGYGVYGSSSSGSGVYGTSATGTAGYFSGNVTVTGTLTVGSTTYTSDRNLKTGEVPIDSHDVLERLSRLPISSWTYKTDPDRRHVGPMAQDFHAAFGLNGSDETHINEVDVAGVSLAAIQELNARLKHQEAEMKQKDTQIAELKALVSAESEAFAARMAAVEHELGVRPQTASLR